MDLALWKKNYLLMLHFPELVQTVKQLKKEVEELKKKSEVRSQNKDGR